MLNAVNSALQGLRYHQRDFARHAERISEWGRPRAQTPAPEEQGEQTDLVADLVGVLQAKHGYQANLAVVKAADDMIGTLLDVLA